MKIEYKEGLIVLKDQDEEVGYIKYVRKEEKVIEDRKSTRLNSSHIEESRMPSSA